MQKAAEGEWPRFGRPPHAGAGLRRLVTARGQADILLMGAATLSIGVDLPISDGRTQHYAMDSGSTLYDIDAVYGDLAEFDALAYKFYADITEGVNQPVALAAFPTRSAR